MRTLMLALLLQLVGCGEERPGLQPPPINEITMKKEDA